MTVLCSACGAENRDAAKFCKGCGRKIAQAWPQGTPVAVGASEATVRPGAAPSLPSAAAPAPAPAPVAAIEELEPGPAPHRPRIGNGRWITGLALGVALLVLAAFWWGHERRSQEVAEPEPARAVDAAANSTPAQAEPAAASAAPAAADPLPAADVPKVQAEKVDLAPAPAPAPALAPAPAHEPVPASGAAPAVPKTRKPATRKQAPPTPAPVIEAQVPAPAPAPPAPEPVRSVTPQEACAGRNFIARSQCLAEQCARANMAGHPQCEAVRRQQRIEEERRNPTMGGAG